MVMESVSTFDFGTSPAQGLIRNQALQLRNLADSTRNLVGVQNSAEGFNLKKIGLLSLGNEESSPKNKEKELMQVAQKFEALLIHQMLKAMRATVHKSDMLDSFTLQQYESMMDEEIANEMAKQRGIGLADMLFYQLSKLEAAANPAESKGADNVSNGVNRHE